MSESATTFLDGNQGGPNGEAPNNRNYTWTVMCNSRTVTGTATFSGSITSTWIDAKLYGNNSLFYNYSGTLNFSYSETTSCQVSLAGSIASSSDCTIIDQPPTVSGNEDETSGSPGVACDATFGSVPQSDWTAGTGPAEVGPVGLGNPTWDDGVWDVGPGSSSLFDWVRVLGTCSTIPAELTADLPQDFFDGLSAEFQGSFNYPLNSTYCDPGPFAMDDGSICTTVDISESATGGS